MQYLVKWSIDIFEVNTPEEAATKALEQIVDLDSIAHVFHVQESGNEFSEVTIDLDETPGSIVFKADDTPSGEDPHGTIYLGLASPEKKVYKIWVHLEEITRNPDNHEIDEECKSLDDTYLPVSAGEYANIQEAIEVMETISFKYDNIS